MAREIHTPLPLAHRQANGIIVIDALREARAPFSPDVVVKNVILPLANAYRIYKIFGDFYAGNFARDPLRRAGKAYDIAQLHTSDLYREMAPLLNSGHIRHAAPTLRAINQICSLEISTKRTGRDQITHPPHGNDDLATVCAGVAYFARNRTTALNFDGFQPDAVDRDVPKQTASTGPTNNDLMGYINTLRFRGII